MPRRPCLICGQLASGSYCDRHRRGGSIRAWRNLRAQAVSRDGHRCVERGATERLAAHHVVPVAEGGVNTLDNLAVLCKGCHGAVHRSGVAP